MPETLNSDIDENSSRRIDVELFIAHPTLSPAEITAALGLEAHFAHGVGDPRKALKGITLEGRYPDTRWRHSIRYTQTDQWFADKVSMLVNSLMPQKTFLHHLRDTGGSAQIIVQFLGDGYLTDSVPSITLTTMAELRLDFGIECFAIPQS